jgi:uncharacterized protein YbaR (Trm112 family)
MPEPSRIELVCPLCKGKFTESLAGLKRDPALACPMCGTFLGKAALTKAIKDARGLLRLRRLLGDMNI